MVQEPLFGRRAPPDQNEVGFGLRNNISETSFTKLDSRAQLLLKSREPQLVASAFEAGG